MKFAIFQILKAEPKPSEVIPCHFMLQRPEQLQSKSIQYPVQLIQKLDSEHWSLLEVRDQEALNIAEKLYAKGSALKPEYLNFHNELHMTMDSDLFHEGIKLGYDEDYIPLYQGKHIHQFDQAFTRPFEYHLKKEELEKRLKIKEINRMAKALGGKAGLQKLGIENQEALEAFHAFNYQKPRLAFRDIASNTNERTLIMALLPPEVSAGNTIWLSFPYNYCVGKKQSVLRREEPLEKLLWLMGLANSLPIDFIARLFVDMHVNKTYFMRLPFIQPENLGQNEYAQIIGLSARLVLACDVTGTMAQAVPELSRLAKQYSGSKSHIELPNYPKHYPPQNEKDESLLRQWQSQQDVLRVELDLSVAKLYKLNAQEMQYILESFPIVRQKRQNYCGLLQAELKELG